MNKKEVLQKIETIKTLFPTVKQINIDYYGSGDSFESYSCIRDQDDNHIEIDSELYDDLAEELFQLSSANFNNEGSQGTIRIDLEKNNASIHNYYIITDTEDGGIYTLL